MNHFLNIQKICIFSIIYIISNALYTNAHTIDEKIELIENDSLQYLDDDYEYNLVIASLKGDYAIVEGILEKGISANTVLEESITPLIYGAQGGHLKICKLLVSKGADINLHPKNGPSPLIAAVRGHHNHIIDYLLSLDTQVDIGDEYGRSALIYAAAYGDTSSCLKLLANKADINKKDTTGINSLMAAAMSGNTYIIDLLLSKGTDINSVDKDGITSVMIATGRNDMKTLDFLLERGADINIVSKRKQTALTIALEKNDEALVQHLIDKGANVNQRLTMAETPLTVANFYNADKFIIEALLNKSANQNLLPDFRKFIFGPEISFNFDDFLAGFMLGIKDYKYDISLTGGMLFRPFYSRILAKIDNKYYQFWERRTSIYAGIDKNFVLQTKEGGIKRGINIGVFEYYSFGSYRGTGIEPKSNYFVVPSIGIYQESKYFQVGISYKYMDFGYEGVPPHKICLSLKVLLGHAFSFNQDNYKPIN